MSVNISFFLVPKREISYLPFNCTMRQALESMEHHGYTAVPLIDEDNKYVGTLTEGDLLWKFKNTPGLTLKGAEKIPLSDIVRRVDNRPVQIYASMEDLLDLAIDQNFVPVVDDGGVFIGIVRRRDIIEYYAGKQREEVRMVK